MKASHARGAVYPPIPFEVVPIPPPAAHERHQVPAGVELPDYVPCWPGHKVELLRRYAAKQAGMKT